LKLTFFDVALACLLLLLEVMVAWIIMNYEREVNDGRLNVGAVQLSQAKQSHQASAAIAKRNRFSFSSIPNAIRRMCKPKLEIKQSDDDERAEIRRGRK